MKCQVCNKEVEEHGVKVSTEGLELHVMYHQSCFDEMWDSFCRESDTVVELKERAVDLFMLRSKTQHNFGRGMLEAIDHLTRNTGEQYDKYYNS